MARKVDPERFMGVGAVVDWAAVSKTQTGQKVVSAGEIAERRKLGSTSTYQLRWSFAAGLGYPVTPFTVWWRRPDLDVGGIDFTPVFGFAGQALLLHGSYAEVVVTLDDGPGGAAMAFHGMPLATMVSAIAPVAAGATEVRLTAPLIRVVTVPAGSVVSSIRGRETDLADDGSWEPIEVVGLPGDGRSSSWIDLTLDQGMVGAPTSPEDAAYDRFRRGAPFYGWPDTIVPGVGAPPWVLADPRAIVKLFWAEMLDDFIAMVDTGTSADQSTLRFQRTVSTPTGQPASMTFNPLAMLLYGGATDPLDALVTGFGTAYPAFGGDGLMTHAVLVNRRPLIDFMVTATFRDPLGKDREWAALILGIGPTLPPPAPGNLAATVQGVNAPDALDDPFRPVVTMSWDKPTNLLPFHLGSLATARRADAPAAPVTSLLRPRPGDVALQPIGGSDSLVTPLRRSSSDSSWEIDAGVTPNSLRYSVAAQSIFGLWSTWSDAGCTASEPPVSKADLSACRMDTSPGFPGTGWCPTTLHFDVAWNWGSRRPATLEVVGRRFPQTWSTDPPPPGAVPTGDSFASTGEGLLVRLGFDLDGEVDSLTAGFGLSATVDHLSVDGQQLSAVALTNRGARRYRVTVSGAQLDFAASGVWGCGLWARGTERRAPGRVGPFGSQPVVVSAADPRPPVITAEHEDVALASLRDTDGLHHADLAWSALPGATTYRIYSCSEATFRAMHGMPEPRPSQTLSQRLAELRARFQANPDRRPWTRTSGEPVSGTTVPIVLPRGTKDLHLFLVLGVSAGEIESAWPDVTDPQRGKRFVAFAAPQVVSPGAPELEITRTTLGDGSYAAGVRIRSAAGALVERVELHRVRVPDAAVQVDTMGPPVASIAASGGGYTVVATPAAPAGPTSGGTAQPVGTVTGVDTVGGSWKPVFYRAVAWGTDDPTRGQYAGRSRPSAVRQVVVPPSAAPDLAGPTYVLPTAGSAQVRVDLSTAAPVATTALGDHRLEAEVQESDGTTFTAFALVGPDGSTGPVASWTLADLPEAAPASPGSGLWRDPTAAGRTPLHLLVRRSEAEHGLRVRLRLTDPLGRITERLLDVPTATLDAEEPDLVLPTVTEVTGGWILAFTTGVPHTNAEGAFRVEVGFTPSTPPRRRIRVGADLADVPLAPTTGGLLDGPPIADVVRLMRTRRTAGSTSVGVGFRRPGTAVVAVVAPSGARATVTRRIGGL